MAPRSLPVTNHEACPALAAQSLERRSDCWYDAIQAIFPDSVVRAKTWLSSGPENGFQIFPVQVSDHHSVPIDCGFK